MPASLRAAARPWPSFPGSEFVLRAATVALFVAIAYQFEWEQVRFLTSEAVLRLSLLMGLPAERVSPNTIQVSGGMFEYTPSCAFIYVVAGAIPLLWDVRRPVYAEFLRIVAILPLLFALNLVHLECAQMLHSFGLPWTLTDGVLGGFAYFAVWLFVWRNRTWELPST